MFNLTGIKGFIGTWFQKALENPDVNSRLVFLASGLGSVFCVIFLSIAFVFVKDKDSYPFMAGTVGGTGVAAAAGRYLTKKNVNGVDGTNPPS